jgi:uncharacterized protein (DUF1810 family)
VTDDLERFVAAQEGVYPGVVRELRSGRKTGHWIWFIFHRSRASRRSSCPGSMRSRRWTGQAYLAHQVLGPRLRECAELVLATRDVGRGHLRSLDAMKVARA